MSEEKIHYYLDKFKKIQYFLRDKESKIILENIKEYMLTFDRKYLDAIDYSKENQYFIKEIVDYLEDKIIVDCGAYNGDTIKILVKQTNINVKHIYAFEATYLNYIELLKSIEYLNIKDLVTPVNKGVWHKKEKLFMSQNEGKMSRVSSKKEAIEVDLINLDSFFSSSMRVGFIKMDIEGSELNALKGAEKLIQRDRPILAVSIYHSAAEYVDIPLYLNNILNNYSFIIRHHWHRLSETIIYCIPNEMV